MGNSALAITEEHRELADAAQRQLSRFNSRVAARATLEDGKSHPADLWSASVAVGWPGLAIAEEFGGSGFGLSELAIVLEAQGRELCPGPFLPSVTAAVVIDRCGGSTLRQRWLPGLADGSVVGAVGLSGDVTVGSDLVATGASPAALGAPDAGVLVLLAGDDVVVVDA
nr:acyl-CoA dehydrogenase family protein [Actinomycetota bacterium]